MKAIHLLAAAPLSIALLASGPAFGADFYRGKDVELTIGANPGGGYDGYARLTARYVAKNIPGQARRPAKPVCIWFNTWLKSTCDPRAIWHLQDVGHVTGRRNIEDGRLQLPRDNVAYQSGGVLRWHREGMWKTGGLRVHPASPGQSCQSPDPRSVPS